MIFARLRFTEQSCNGSSTVHSLKWLMIKLEVYRKLARRLLFKGCVSDSFYTLSVMKQDDDYGIGIVKQVTVGCSKVAI
jgi:hypothetical protein